MGAAAAGGSGIRGPATAAGGGAAAGAGASRKRDCAFIGAWGRGGVTAGMGLSISNVLDADTGTGWSIGNVFLPPKCWSGSSIGNVEEKILGVAAAVFTGAWARDSPGEGGKDTKEDCSGARVAMVEDCTGARVAVVEGIAKSPKSSSSMSRNELGCEADWGWRPRLPRPEESCREAGCCCCCWRLGRNLCTGDSSWRLASLGTGEG